MTMLSAPKLVGVSLCFVVPTLLAALPSIGMSFDSYGVPGVLAGAIHGEITQDATKRLGINECDGLQQAVRAPDWEQTSIQRFSLRPNDKYRASHHFDRGPDLPSDKAFAQAAFFVRTERTKCLEFAKSATHDAALASLGRVLHAVQDLVSHSNLIDLTSAQRQQVVVAIWDERQSVPAQFKLTGYSPKAKIPGEPPGDPYAHDRFSKDNPNKNTESKLKVRGQTKHRIAYALAIDLSESVLVGLKNELGPGPWKAFSETFD